MVALGLIVCQRDDKRQIRMKYVFDQTALPAIAQRTQSCTCFFYLFFFLKVLEPDIRAHYILLTLQTVYVGIPKV